ncbi:MAG: SusD/RagB family nutrient-binding outer membrane lipoprotein [Flavobacteriales bacterium]|nr:MAG: SusD/RagB family nutrient-binding outer membrane lipoprotein [Flavobacteriales bacterium]
MKNFLNNITIILTFSLLLISCGDEYHEVNRPSNTAYIDQLKMSDLLAPVIHSTMEGQRSAELTFGNYVQNFVFQGGVATGQSSVSGLWKQVYLYVLPNTKAIKEKATESNAIHYAAVVDILNAINIGIATDTWDNIPYTEATQAPENNFPIFDTQEQIYNEIFRLLDNAIAALSAEDDSDYSLGKDDLIYNGDIEKWLRAAYTIKARYQLHLVNKGVITPNEVLTTIASGFESNDDNFMMFYDDKNINPWYSSEVLERNTGNAHNDIASQLVSSMNGDYYPFQSGLQADPRLTLFAQKPDGESWKGYVSGGGGKAPDGSDANTEFATNGFYTSIDSPLMLISYAEAKFIEAEAAFLANGGLPTSTGSTSQAYNAYIEGIQASMDMYKVDGSAYLNDGVIAVGQSNLMLHHIMKEKYIHNFLNPETFVDFRRYDFSNQVFTGLTIREEEESDDTQYFGQWFRRAIYPDSELNRNEANVLANKQEPVTPVWWDAE